MNGIYITHIRNILQSKYHRLDILYYFVVGNIYSLDIIDEFVWVDVLLVVQLSDIVGVASKRKQKSELIHVKLMCSFDVLSYYLIF